MHEYKNINKQNEINKNKNKTMASITITFKIETKTKTKTTLTFQPTHLLPSQAIPSIDKLKQHNTQQLRPSLQNLPPLTAN
jgi:ethanolamine ammonia-lyase small subunit